MLTIVYVNELLNSSFHEDMALLPIMPYGTFLGQ